MFEYLSSKFNVMINDVLPVILFVVLSGLSYFYLSDKMKISSNNAHHRKLAHTGQESNVNIDIFTKDEKNELRLFMHEIQYYYNYDKQFKTIWNGTIQSIIDVQKIEDSSYSKYRFRTLFSDAEMCKIDSVSYLSDEDVLKIHFIISKVYRNAFSVFSLQDTGNSNDELSIFHNYFTKVMKTSDSSSVEQDAINEYANRVTEFFKKMYIYYSNFISNDGILGFKYNEYKNKYEVPQEYITPLLRLHSNWLSTRYFDEDVLVYHILYLMVRSAYTNTDEEKRELGYYLRDQQDLIILINSIIEDKMNDEDSF